MFKSKEITTNRKKILAIIPAYNEEVALGSIILRTKKYVNRVVVVDDGSEDKTSDVAKLAGAEVIVHDTNLGKGKALKSGFESIKDEDIIITIDGDGQNNPDEIPTLVEPILNSYSDTRTNMDNNNLYNDSDSSGNGIDIVNGSRYLNGNKDDTPRYRRVGQKVLDKATNISSGLNITDSQSGYRAFSKIAIPYFKLKNSGFAIESEMLSDAAEAGLNIVEVPITVRYDVDGSTKNPVSHGVKVLLKIIKSMELKRPLYYFTFPGFIISIIGLIATILFLNDYIQGISVNFGPTVIAILMIVVGLFLMLNGILLDSMRRLINSKL
jgi:glycosyltransferase involved in cell wall biosynthesis